MKETSSLQESVLSIARLLDLADKSRVTYIILVGLALFSAGQLPRPFIAHDDFDYLVLSSQHALYETTWHRTLSEGRWLSYAWSNLSHLLSIREAYLLFMAIASISFVGVHAQISSKGLAGFSAFACASLMLSPMFVSHHLWPASLAPAYFVLLLAVFSMGWDKYLTTRRFFVSLLFVYFAVMAYPSIAGVIFMCLVIGCSNLRTIQWAFLAAAYVVAYAAAVGTIFTLNLVFHGVFGIVAGEWRDPQPLHSFAQLMPNFLLYMDVWKQAWRVMRWSLIVAAPGYAICIAFDVKRHNCLLALLSSIFLLSIDAALSIINGVSIGLRSCLWIWLAVCLPGLFLFETKQYSRWGAAILAVCLGAGIVSWLDLGSKFQPIVYAADALADRIKQAQSLTGAKDSPVVFFGSADNDPSLGWPFGDPDKALGLYLLKEHNLQTVNCKEINMCEDIRERTNPADTLQYRVISGKLVYFLSNTSLQ